jgi:hypothetical protein
MNLLGSFVIPVVPVVLDLLGIHTEADWINVQLF